MSYRKSLLLIPLLATFLVSGCGRDKLSVEPRIVLEGYNPPKFIVSGQGRLDIITVDGPDPEHKTSEDAAPSWKDYWVIMPKGNYDLSSFKELGTLTYGQVPEGFEQIVPKSGKALPLVEGKTYSIQLRTKDGPAFSKFFALREGKIVDTGD